MKTMHRSIDPQLQLSILFLALAEKKLQAPEPRPASERRRAPERAPMGVAAMEYDEIALDPERWDGMF
jgi:hypothetical protein